MGKPSRQLLQFMEAHKIDSDEVWEVRTGGAWAVKHAALERVATERGITFASPVVLEAKGQDKVVALCIIARMGERSEWSIGEAAPGNNKNAYPYAMAEKRGKDRCILKLLNSHGTLYSEAEADEFRENPHTTKPSDIYEPTEHDENGQPIDNIPNGDPNIKPLPKKNAKEIFTACQAEIRACLSVEELEQWGALNKDRVAQFPADWKEIIRGVYADKRDEIRSKIGMNQFRNGDKDGIRAAG